MGGDDTGATDAAHPPAGTWFRISGIGIVFGARHRGLSRNRGVLLAALFGNGVLLLFLRAFLAGTLAALHLPVPAFFPPMEKPPTLGLMVLLWCFLAPFMVICLAPAWRVLSCLFGKTEVRLADATVAIFTGIGGVGRTKRFHRSEVRDVFSSISKDSAPTDPVALWIRTRSGKQVQFGTQLSVEGGRFIVAALREQFLGKNRPSDSRL
jgi:hypothetical protein